MQDIIKEKWKVMLIIFLISGGLTYIITKFFITPKYESTSVIFPPNTHANIHLVSAGMRFGYDKEIGEHMEILNSNYVRNQLIEEFSLIDHYGLSKSDPLLMEHLSKKYDRNISPSRTINKSIHIVVRDEDPEIAKNMANRLIEIADHHKSNMVKKNIQLALTSAEKSYLEKKKTVVLMTDSLESLRQAGESVWSYGEERKSGKYINYELQYRKELDLYHSLKTRWEELSQLMAEEIPKSYVVSAAQKAGKPVYPKKLITSLLVGLAAVGCYLLLSTIRSSNVS